MLAYACMHAWIIYLVIFIFTHIYFVDTVRACTHAVSI